MKPYPMTSDQMALYHLIKDNQAAQTAYNETLLISFWGSLNLENLQNAINKLIFKHESLRTVFLENGREQIVLPAQPYPLTITSVEKLNQNEKKACLKQWLISLSDKILDLHLGPLYNFFLFQLSPQCNILAITAVNSLSDGISFSILTDELSKFYNDPNIDLDSTVQFSDFIALHEELIKSSYHHTIFWENMLLKKDIRRINFPSSKSRPTRMSFSGFHQRFDIEKNIMQHLRIFSKKNRISLFSCLLGFFCLAVHRLTQQDDITIGIPFAYRQRAEFESSVGFCITIFPIRANFLTSDTLLSYLLRIRNTTLGMFENCYVDINKILDKTNIKCDETRPIFFDVLFNLERPGQKIDFNGLMTYITGLNSPYSNLNIDLNNIDDFKISSNHAQFDLTANLIEDGDSCAAAFEYNTDIFCLSDIARIISTFNEMLDLVLCLENIVLSQIMQ